MEEAGKWTSVYEVITISQNKFYLLFFGYKFSLCIYRLIRLFIIITIFNAIQFIISERLDSPWDSVVSQLCACSLGMICN